MILDDIVAYKRMQLKVEKEANPEFLSEKKKKRKPEFLLKSEEEANAQSLINGETKSMEVRDFKAALNKDNISIIGEIKRASPSAGEIKKEFDLESIAKVYESIEIDAISVLTEKKFFLGSDEYINQVKKLTSKPILRKDFIIDKYQIYQSKAIGADAILLIASVLGSSIKDFYEEARSIGLHCIAEVHNIEELNIVLSAGCDIIGINNRDLKTFKVDLKTTENLIKYIPGNITIVSESGIKTPDDIIYLKSLGVNAVLIGETLMRMVDNVDKIRAFIDKSRKIV